MRCIAGWSDTMQCSRCGRIADGASRHSHYESPFWHQEERGRYRLPPYWAASAWDSIKRMLQLYIYHPQCRASVKELIRWMISNCRYTLASNPPAQPYILVKLLWCRLSQMSNAGSQEGSLFFAQNLHAKPYPETCCQRMQRALRGLSSASLRSTFFICFPQVGHI